MYQSFITDGDTILCFFKLRLQFAISLPPSPTLEKNIPRSSYASYYTTVTDKLPPVLRKSIHCSDTLGQLRPISRPASQLPSPLQSHLHLGNPHRQQNRQIVQLLGPGG
jgi:hypothetical protein